MLLSLEPDRALRDVLADPEHEERRPDANPKHRSPREIAVRLERRKDEVKDERRHDESPLPAALQQAGGDPAQARGPVLEDERHPGRPLATHADAEQRTEPEQHRVRRREPLKPAKSENHRIEIMRGSRRPHRSAAVPARAPPTNLMKSVTVPSAPASARSIVKLFWMSIRMKVRMVKSKPSSAQPRNVAQKARHCMAFTCRYQGPAGCSGACASSIVAIRSCSAPMRVIVFSFCVR